MLITVALGGTTKYNEHGQPYNEGGRLGYMESTELTYKEYVEHDNENEYTVAKEYWEGDQLRQRSIDMQLKKPLLFESAIGDIG